MANQGMNDFDDLLRKVGQLGRHQVFHYLLLGPLGACCGFQLLLNVFAAATPVHWCSELGNQSDQHVQGLTTPPGEGFSSHPDSACWFYEVENRTYLTLDLGSEVYHDPMENNSFLPHEGTRRRCRKWDYDYDEYGTTIVTEWDLVCSKAILSKLASSLHFIGYLIGCIVFGYVSDSIGRKSSICIAVVSLALLGSASAFIPDYWGHVIVRMLSAISCAGGWTCGFVLLMEMLGPERRMLPGITMGLYPPLGYMTMAGVAYLLKDYQWLILVGSAPSVLLAGYYWIISESPRWLLTKGRYAEAEQEILRMAKNNKRQIEEKEIQELFEHVKRVKEEHHDRSQESYTVFSLLRTPNMRRKSLNIFFSWFVVSFTYYGLSMGVSDLAGSPHLNLVISGLAEIPGLTFACVTLDRLGRRIPLALLLIGGGLACLVVLVLPQEWHIAITVLSMIGKMGASGAFGAIYVYSAELFPTVLRTTGVGAGSMFARGGGLLAPLVAALGDKVWKPLPLLVFGGCSVLAGGISLFLPETLNAKLPETLDDGEHFGERPYVPPLELEVVCNDEAERTPLKSSID